MVWNFLFEPRCSNIISKYHEHYIVQQVCLYAFVATKFVNILLKQRPTTHCKNTEAVTVYDYWYTITSYLKTWT